MAAQPNVPAITKSPLSNRYDENTNGSNRMPTGPCNFEYVNLVNVGGAVPKCGCRRFTDKSLDLQGYLNASPMRPGWCICEHHSCYHDHNSVDGHRAPGDVFIAEESSMTPKKQLVHAQTPAPSLPDVLMQDVPEVGAPGRHDSLPDTFQWNRFIKSGSSQGSLPAIPSQCLLPSDSGSRASSSHVGNYRPFGGVGLNTLTRAPAASPGRNPLNLGKGRTLGDNGKMMQAYQDSNGLGHLQSLTEVATPSAQTSQDPDAEVAFSKDVASLQGTLQMIEEDGNTTVSLKATGKDPARSSATIRDDATDDQLLPRLRSIMNHVADYPMTMRNHKHRLEQLENASFNCGHAQLQDDYALSEMRIGDVEARISDVEKQLQAPSDTNSVGSRQLLSATMESRSSSAMIASAIDDLDNPRIQALEAEIAELRALVPPTHAHPLELEVVFIPFGTRLRGIWSSPHSSMTPLSRVNSASGDEWTQTQNNSLAAAQARLTAQDQIVAWETSASNLIDQPSPWLMPKACGVGSLVDERLRSRGLVRKISIKGPDARDVQSAMLSAFGDLPGYLAADPYSQHEHRSSIPIAVGNFLGLQAPWIPLRKVHKNSCLRFLNTSEMITPALWTVQFLSSSVAMRSTGVRRLYVTHADSYIQHLGSTVSWTWQKIRQLDRVYPDGVNHTPEADANEPCWNFNERYDPPPSLSSSIASIHSLTIRPVPYAAEEPVSPSDHFSSAPASPGASTTPTTLPPLSARQVSPLKERHPFRSIHTRTTSMPSLVPIKSSPPQLTKRRITSFEHESQSSPTRAVPMGLTLKRQRTRSPSRPRDTPRWSVGPPSPYTYVDEYKRGNTPFAYATPHSNAPYIPRHVDDEEDNDYEQGSTTNGSDGDDGERNALSDFESEGESGDQGRQVEESEWQGVGESGGDKDDVDSDSCPSEYPSTQKPKALFDHVADAKAGFRIHVDDEIDEAAS